MIEVNLNPSGRKQRSGRGFSFSMPSFGRGEDGDGRGTDWWVLSAVAAWLLALGYIGLTWTGVNTEQEDLQVRLETAQADSARFAAQSARIAALRARRDSINDRIETIQAIDQGRYIWAHVMDEVARALPDYTWVTAITAQSSEPSPQFEIQGYAGTQTAVAVFQRQLEASPFFEQLSVQSIEAEDVGEVGNQQRVQAYVIQAVYIQPPFEMLESVPLFDGDAPAASTVTGGD
jgi:Tfp pilus assembly protein PilN